jgi:hypothetical protein
VRRVANLLTNAALFAVALTFAVYAAEGVLRWLEPEGWESLHKRRIAAAEEAGVPFDQRMTLEVLLDLRQQGQDAHPSIKPFNFLSEPFRIERRDILPLSGIRNVLTVFNGNETGEFFVYQSDEYGFHNPPGLHLRDEVDVAAIGDSYIHGVAVRSGEGIVSKIRAAVPRTVNLGMGASGPLIELAILKEYVKPLRPNVVLWGYYEGNDLSDLRREGENALLREYLELERGPFHRRRQKKIDRKLIAFADSLVERHSKTQKKAGATEKRQAEKRQSLKPFLRLRVLRGKLRLAFSPREERQQPDFDLLRQVLTRAQSWTEGWGGRLYFVYLPEYARYSSKAALSADGQERQSVLRLVEELGLPTIDVAAALAEHEDATTLFPFDLPGHYDVDGCQVVADTIVGALEEDGALSR